MSSRSLSSLADLILLEIQAGDFASARVLLRAYAVAWALVAVRASC